MALVADGHGLLQMEDGRTSLIKLTFVIMRINAACFSDYSYGEKSIVQQGCNEVNNKACALTSRSS